MIDMGMEQFMQFGQGFGGIAGAASSISGGMVVLFKPVRIGN